MAEWQEYLTGTQNQLPVEHLNIFSLRSEVHYTWHYQTVLSYVISFSIPTVIVINYTIYISGSGFGDIGSLYSCLFSISRVRISG